jgi:hypothetical protein
MYTTFNGAPGATGWCGGAVTDGRPPMTVAEWGVQKMDAASAVAFSKHAAQCALCGSDGADLCVDGAELMDVFYITLVDGAGQC